MNASLRDSFGNYLLRGIQEAELPEPVSWLPQTLGWKILAALALLLMAYQSYLAGGRWWRNRYRRSALRTLAELEESAGGNCLQVVAQLPQLLKATALHAYPRADIAALSGQPWLQFLDAHYRGPSFRSGVGMQLLTVAYQAPAHWRLSPSDARALVGQCRQWLRHHKVDQQ